VGPKVAAGGRGAAAAVPARRLTKDWQDEAAAFNKRSLAGTDFVYLWVDGIHLKVRLEQDKVCLLVMVGVHAGGAKELVALDDGHRESTESWLDLLRSCKRRGMRPGARDRGRGARVLGSAARGVPRDSRAAVLVPLCRRGDYADPEAKAAGGARGDAGKVGIIRPL
jgi:hypothetical protein